MEAVVNHILGRNKVVHCEPEEIIVNSYGAFFVKMADLENELWECTHNGTGGKGKIQRKEEWIVSDIDISFLFQPVRLQKIKKMFVQA